MRVVGCSLSEAKGAPRTVRDTLELDALGIRGDRHAGPGLRQVSLMSAGVIRDAHTADADAPFPAGAGRENVAVDGLESLNVRVLDRFRIGNVVLETTQLGAAWRPGGPPLCAGACMVSDHGVFCRVIAGGAISVGSEVEHAARALRAEVVTLSDRVSEGVYADRSGPRAVELLQAFGAARGWTMHVETATLPDDPAPLTALLQQCRDVETDLVITTGGTGIGPRDCAPETVNALADRRIPGIMEHIRVKYGAEKPLALLSRGVAAQMRRTLVFTLPGSPRAVDEYLAEITPLLEHLVLTLRGIDAHS